MIIEEKGLVKAIKIAYRHGGYTVLNQGGEVTIYTEGWFVRCLWPARRWPPSWNTWE